MMTRALMGEIWGRVYKLEVGDAGQLLTIDGFGDDPAQITFRVGMSANSFYQTAEINIYGLSKENRGLLYERYLDVRLTAGYRDSFAQIFVGTIYNVAIGRDGPEVIATIYCRAQGEVWASASVNQSWGDSTPAQEIIKDVAETFGYPVVFIGVFDDLPRAINGMTISEDSKTAMRSLARNYSFTWSIENGEMIITRIGAGRLGKESIFNISADSGMVGTPRITERGIDVTSKMNPAIRPYDTVQVENATSELVFNNPNVARSPNTLGVGRYRVIGVSHVGDYNGDQWDTILEGYSPRVRELPRTGQ
jgi:hypothetical protein